MTKSGRHSKNHGSLAGGISLGFAARDGSAVKSHSTILQRLRRQISLDYYTIPPATQAREAGGCNPPVPPPPPPQYSLVGYPLRAISGHKMSKMVNVKVIQTDIFALTGIDNGMSNNNKANQ